MDFLLKFQAYVQDGKECREINEAIKSMVEDLFVFQEEHPEALTKIPEMSP